MCNRTGSKAACVLMALVSITTARANTSSKLWDVTQIGTNGSHYVSGATVLGQGLSGGEPAANVSFDIEWGQIGRRYTSPQPWQNFNGFSFAIENKESFDMTFGFRLELNPERTSVIGTAFTVKAGERRKIYLDLSSTNIADMGMRSSPPVMPGFYSVLRPWNGSATLAPVHSWQIYYKGTTKGKAAISDLTGHEFDMSFTGIVDQFGQLSYQPWGVKVEALGDFASNANDEVDHLAANPSLNEEVGSRKLQRQPPGRRWQVFKSPAGKWYFRHPAGRTFWSLGLTSVHNSSPTIVEGREHMFTNLPAEAGEFAQFYGSVNRNGVPKKTFDFYGANLYHKYGADWKQESLKHAYKRMKSWGFNTLGSGSNLSSVFEDPTPYTMTLTTNAFPVRLETPNAFWRKIVDPFAEDFENWAATTWHQEIKYSNGYQGFMGVYVDGENVWGVRDGTDAGYYMLPIATLKAPGTQPAKQAFINDLKANYVGINRLNDNWGTNFASWDEMLNPITIDPNAINAAMKLDFSAWLKRFSVTYYSKVRSALAKAGNTALFLGTKDCTYWTPDEIFWAASKFCDTLSVTYYAASENVDWTYLNNLGRPVLIAEFSFMGRDRGAMAGSFAPDIDAPDQAARAQMAKTYLQKALSMPNIIGIHWFTYIDQPITGRASDGENWALGLVDVSDTPYREVTDMFRQVASNMYLSRGY